MKWIPVIAFVVAVPVCAVFAQMRTNRSFRDNRAGQGTRTERELQRAEQEEMQAVSRHDTEALRQLLADEFTFVGSRSTGERTHKDRYIDNILRYNWRGYEFSDFFIRVYDRTAVVNCRFSRQVSLQGRDMNGDFLFTDVWVKRGGRWQLVARHSTQLHGQ